MNLNMKYQGVLFSEPTVLTGEGEYNINIVKEVKVTDSYLGLDQDVRGCQSHEIYNDCITKHHLHTIQNTCGCIPFNIRLGAQVFTVFNIKGRV